MKTARSVSGDDPAGSASDASGSIVLQDVQKPSDENVSIASTLQMMGINLSSSTTTDDNWNQDLLHDNIGRSEQNYSNHYMLQATSGFINSSMNYGQNLSMNSFRQENQNLIPFNSASYGYNSSTLFQTLFDTDSHSTNYLSSPNDMNSTEFCPSLTNDSKPSFPKQQTANNNNNNIWSFGASDFLPSNQPQLLLPSSLNSAKPNLHNLSTKQQKEEAVGLNSVTPKKISNEEPPFKRPRIETPSPLPTFKLRKEKLGDRITALQQLVSPFGKTDTASVLNEAIEYIKFLHVQVSVLSTPYLKNGSPQLQHEQAADKIKDEKGQIQDLKIRGLYLVPIPRTFPVAAETTTDLWSPTFGGSFR